MQYFGGKSKISKEICQVLEKYRKPNQIFVEPFVGGANIVTKMTGMRLAFDIHEPLIKMYKALQEGWIPPETLSKEEYYQAKESDDLPLKAFAGFGCSFAGKYFGGYAKNDTTRKYCANAKNSLLKKVKTLEEVVFVCADYRTLSFKDCLIYCDPPYSGTTQYSNGKFDSNEFWDIVRKWSKENTVITSEYAAPLDFEVIWEKETKTEIRTTENGRESRIEKLFKLK